MVCFGPFTIDPRTWTLTRDNAMVDLSPRLVEILAHLVAREGAVATKDELLDRFWPDTHVTENTLTRAIADIRKALDDSADQPAFVQTMARRGYRFIGTLARPEVDAVLGGGDPLRHWVEGRLALESLDDTRLVAATRGFEKAVAAMPDYAPAHAGLANAYLLTFELTRHGNRPDRATIERAVAAARRASALDASLGEAWAVLGHALALAGEVEDARVAARRAATLEPGNWRHQFRLALVTWGEERLRAVDRTLALVPGCAAAHLLSSMVFIARGAVDLAAHAADAGAALQDQQPISATLPAAGLHWVRGLAHVAAGDTSAAALAFDREIHHALPSRVYAREFALSARLALGFLRAHSGDREAAVRVFGDVLATVPGHARATLGLTLCGEAAEANVLRAIGELEEGGKKMDAALVRAGVVAWRGDASGAANVLTALLAVAPQGPVGWGLRADPLFLPLHGSAAFQGVVSAVAARAA
jgi:DNA-binding winged helix-turn-helix (wHTH) protein